MTVEYTKNTIAYWDVRRVAREEKIDYDVCLRHEPQKLIGRIVHVGDDNGWGDRICVYKNGRSFKSPKCRYVVSETEIKKAAEDIYELYKQPISWLEDNLVE